MRRCCRQVAPEPEFLQSVAVINSCVDFGLSCVELKADNNQLITLKQALNTGFLCGFFNFLCGIEIFLFVAVELLFVDLQIPVY